MDTLRHLHSAVESSDSSPRAAAEPAGANVRPGYEEEAEKYRRLRSILLGWELAELESLKERLNNQETHAREISAVIAEAILLRTQKDDALSTVLQPTVDNIVQAYLQKDTERVVNQIFPIMGPAIRRSISEAFNSMLQSFSKTLEMSFSWRGLKWRLEAMRTGKSFSDVVLLHTMLYRVEQVFLIHTETGIVLNNVAGEGIYSQDADLVSGMLTAIQDFVRDCFASGEQSSLESLQMGELNIIVKRLPSAYLACVVRGTPPASLNIKLNTILELIVVEWREQLNSFRGDTGPFEDTNRYLEECLISRYVDDTRKPLLIWRLMPLIVLLALVGGFGYLKYVQSKYGDMVDSLAAQPGIVLTKVSPSLLGTWQIAALRDNLALNPEEFLVAQGMPARRFHMQSSPYISLDEGLVRQRVANAIHLPEGVDMEFDDNHVLHFSGEAPMGWIMATREKAMTIPGVQGVDLSSLKDPRAEEMNDLMRKIDGMVIYFPLKQAMPVGVEKEKLLDAVGNMVALEKLARQMGMAITVTIYGHADASGNEKYNYELSQERAKTLAAFLYARGASIPISTYGMGSDFASREEGKSAPDPASRKIMLKVNLVRTGAVARLQP